MVFNGKSKDGVFYPNDKERREKYLLKNEGKEMVENIEPKTKKRTVDQNKLIWFYFNFIEQNGLSGYTAQELHKIFCDDFAYYETLADGREVRYPLRTSGQSTKSFGEMIDYKLRIWTAENFGINLPSQEDAILANYSVRGFK